MTQIFSHSCIKNHVVEPELVDAFPCTVLRKISGSLEFSLLLVDLYDRTLPYTCKFTHSFLPIFKICLMLELRPAKTCKMTHFFVQWACIHPPKIKCIFSAYIHIHMHICVISVTFENHPHAPAFYLILKLAHRAASLCQLGRFQHMRMCHVVKLRESAAVKLHYVLLS